MLYLRKSFTCPASSPGLKQQQWDRAFMTTEEFSAKYPLITAELTDTDVKAAEGVG